MKDYLSSEFVLGILGGGQLGRMLMGETYKLDVRTAVLDPSSDCPCSRLTDRFSVGNLMDYDTVYQFGKDLDMVTIEIEHVNVDALEQLEKDGVEVHPSPNLIRIIQDKAEQKAFYDQNEIPTVPWFRYETLAELRTKKLTFPCVQKTAKFGYDGKGVSILRSAADLDKLADVPGIIEEFIDEKQEISVMVSRNPSGETSCFPAVEMEFHPVANLVEFLFCPANISKTIAERARFIAMNVADGFKLAGVMAVEMFVTRDGEIYVNESAPRPHNSGHHTIESCYTSQYGQHVRAILDLPLGATDLKSAAVMVNLLGPEGLTGPVDRYDGMKMAMRLEGVNVHIYGKKETRPFRKMGHVTVVAEQLEDAREKGAFVKKMLKVRVSE